MLSSRHGLHGAFQTDVVACAHGLGIRASGAPGRFWGPAGLRAPSGGREGHGQQSRVGCQRWSKKNGSGRKAEAVGELWERLGEPLPAPVCFGARQPRAVSWSVSWQEASVTAFWPGEAWPRVGCLSLFLKAQRNYGRPALSVSLVPLRSKPPICPEVTAKGSGRIQGRSSPCGPSCVPGVVWQGRQHSPRCLARPPSAPFPFSAPHPHSGLPNPRYLTNPPFTPHPPPTPNHCREEYGTAWTGHCQGSSSLSPCRASGVLALSPTPPCRHTLASTEARPCSSSPGTPISA